jgi:PhnB protein
MAVQPIPADYPRVSPYLCVHDAAAAIAFYCDVLGATERMRMPAPGDLVGHAELALGDGLIMLADEFPDMGFLSPKSVGGSSVLVHVYVEDADATHARALAAGATERRPVETQFYGDRSGQFEDPFGHLWNVATHVEDVAPDELQRRVEAMTPQG